MFGKKHDDKTIYMIGEKSKAIAPGIVRGKAPLQLEKIVKRNHNKSYIANFIGFSPTYVFFGGQFSGGDDKYVFSDSISLKLENVIEILIKELDTPYPENIFEEAYRHLFPLQKKYVVVEVVMLDLQNNEINITVGIKTDMSDALKLVKDIQPLLKCDIYNVECSKIKLNIANV
jgi:hypothetical protein